MLHIVSFNNALETTPIDSITDDGRMFLDSKLYCEGRDKPLFRGILHLITACFILPAFVNIVYSKVDSTRELSSLVVYFIGNFLCFGTSSLFHCGSWDAKTEILLQKLDHSFIFVKIASVYTSIAILLCPLNNHQQQQYILLASMATWLMAIFGLFHVFTFRSERIKYKLLTICCGIPTYTIFSMFLTNDEKTYCLFVLLFYGIGGYIFSKEICNFYPKTFGYHETFHLFSIIATFVAFQVLNHVVLPLSERCLPNNQLITFGLLQNTYSNINTGICASTLK